MKSCCPQCSASIPGGLLVCPVCGLHVDSEAAERARGEPDTGPRWLWIVFVAVPLLVAGTVIFAFLLSWSGPRGALPGLAFMGVGLFVIVAKRPMVMLFSRASGVAAVGVLLYMFLR